MPKQNTPKPAADKFDSISDDALMSAKRIAPLMGVSLVTLSRRRSKELGPPFMRLSSGRVAYPVGAYREWIKAQTIV